MESLTLKGQNIKKKNSYRAENLEAPPSYSNLSGAHLLDEGQQSLAVVLPLQRQLALVGKLVASQEDGELKAVGVQVTEVVHA